MSSLLSRGETVPMSGAAANKSLQVTFDPPRTFAVAKARVASNAPELGRSSRKGTSTSQTEHRKAQKRDIHIPDCKQRISSRACMFI